MTTTINWGLELPETGEDGVELFKLNQWVYDVVCNCVRVVDRDLQDPPGSPAHGAVYIPAATATAAWAGLEGQFLIWHDDEGWINKPMPVGVNMWIVDEATQLVWDGAALQVIYV